MNCYFCGGKNLKVIRKRLRYNIRRDVLSCRKCGLVYLRPQKANFKEYYDKDYRKLYTPVIGKALSSKEIFETYLPSQKERIQKIRHILNPKMRVLDIGCSTGHFLYAIKKYVHECVGVELNSKNAEFARKKAGIKVYTEPVEKINFPKNYFDLICNFDTIEHVEDPVGFLKVINGLLKPGGHLFIETPNLDDSLISTYKIEPYCGFWFKEPHPFYFSPKTLGLFLKKTGFRGEIDTFQKYNLVNQINWIINKVPQSNFDISAGKPILLGDASANKRIKSDLNGWIQKADREYKTILEKHNIGDTIIFLGKKIKELK